MDNNDKEFEKVREYTNKDVLTILDRLTEEEMGAILVFSSVPDIRDMLNDSSKYDLHLNKAKLVAYYYNIYADILEELRDRVDTLLADNPKDFSADYDKLSDAEKKQTALEMLNNKDFQKNCCEIMVGDYERVVAEDPTCKALDKLLGLGKYFRKCIETGLACDHKYMVCDVK